MPSKLEKYILYFFLVLIFMAVCVFSYFHLVASSTPIGLTNSGQASTTSQVGQSGVYGQVTIGPTCPVMREPPDPQCADRPYQATLKILNQANKIVIDQKINSDGTFKFSLPPGQYTIEDGSSAVMPTLRPISVIVGPNSYTEVDLSFDSGIR